MTFGLLGCHWVLITGASGRMFETFWFRDGQGFSFHLNKPYYLRKDCFMVLVTCMGCGDYSLY
jgi:hypothetical protein